MSSTPRIHRLTELSRTRVAELAPTATLVLPIGATEQHGPDLPIGTDAMSVEAALAAGLEQLRAAADVIIAPTLAYGQSQHHLFACAASLTPATFALVLEDLFASLTTSGFRRIFILNGHGGNDELIRIGVAKATVAHRGLFAAASYWGFVEPADGPGFDHIPGHAGAFEASVLLARYPKLVPAGSIPSSDPGPPGSHVTPIGPGVTLGRHGDWESSAGFTDDPSAGSVQAGSAYLQGLGGRLAQALAAFIATPDAR